MGISAQTRKDGVDSVKALGWIMDCIERWFGTEMRGIWCKKEERTVAWLRVWDGWAWLRAL